MLIIFGDNKRFNFISWLSVCRCCKIYL